MTKTDQRILIAMFSLCICASPVSAEDYWQATEATGTLVLTVTGFSGPEAVRYDPDQDVYFVSNFNGEVSGDANAFVSKVSADGEIIDLKFMVGTDDTPFHGGRGMFIVDDSLWVVDANGIHQFDRHSGEHLDYVDLSRFEPGFPNDIALGPDNNLYVTDTGKSVLYRVANGEASIATETPFAANGITTNPKNGRLIIVPWSGALEISEWDIEDNAFTTIGPTAGGGNYDGVEVFLGAIVTASQVDTSLHFMINGVDRSVIDLAGKPADIAIDTRRAHVAVPFVSLHRVDIIKLQ